MSQIKTKVIWILDNKKKCNFKTHCVKLDPSVVHHNTAQDLILIHFIKVYTGYIYIYIYI